jgi:hypothetical protein
MTSFTENVYQIIDIDTQPGVSETGKDIFDYLEERRSNILVSPQYFTKNQPNITPTMRIILFDWLVSRVSSIICSFFNTPSYLFYELD